jgi:hypothetical protein
MPVSEDRPPAPPSPRIVLHTSCSRKLNITSELSARTTGGRIAADVQMRMLAIVLRSGASNGTGKWNSRPIFVNLRMRLTIYINTSTIHS